MYDLKRILVPTDFSTCAYYASDLALKLAEQLRLEVHFYTRVSTPLSWTELSSKESHPEAIVAFEEMRENFQQLTERYKNSKSRLITTYSYGDISDVISSYIDKEGIDLVIMGSSGAHGLKEWLVGSNSQMIVRRAHCPVLVIKSPTESGSVFSNIIFASDFQEQARKPFEHLLALARVFGSHIHLLYVAPYPKFEPEEADTKRMMSFEKMCRELPCTVHGVGEINIELGITFFASKIKADMLAISNYGESFLKRIFKGSISESLVNHLQIPVLALNTKEQKTWVQLSDSYRG